MFFHANLFSSSSFSSANVLTDIFSIALHYIQVLSHCVQKSFTVAATVEKERKHYFFPLYNVNLRAMETARRES
jgi:hypothetical protein